MRNLTTNPTPPWLHRWAVLTVCATFVLLVLGAVVTTFRVGMADPVWPTSPLYLFFTSWTEPSAGFLIEHSHRFAGWFVGVCAIVLCVGLWFFDSRRWVRYLGVIALLCVIVQGLLGGFRVLLNAILGGDLAMLHGIFAQIVFAVLVSLAIVTSPRWWTGAVRRDLSDAAKRLQFWSLATTGLLFVQIVLGAWVRHTDSRLGQRGHLLIAFAAVAATLWLVKIVWDEHGSERALTLPALFLGVLVFAQVLLGVESWMFRFGQGIPRDLLQVTVGQAVVSTLHVLIGFALMGTSVAVALRSYRRMGVVEPATVEPAGQLEGAL